MSITRRESPEFVVGDDARALAERHRQRAEELTAELGRTQDRLREANARAEEAERRMRESDERMLACFDSAKAAEREAQRLTEERDAVFDQLGIHGLPLSECINGILLDRQKLADHHAELAAQVERLRAALRAVLRERADAKNEALNATRDEYLREPTWDVVETIEEHIDAALAAPAEPPREESTPARGGRLRGLPVECTGCGQEIEPGQRCLINEECGVYFCEDCIPEVAEPPAAREPQPDPSKQRGSAHDSVRPGETAEVMDALDAAREPQAEPPSDPPPPLDWQAEGAVICPNCVHVFTACGYRRTHTTKDEEPRVHEPGAAPEPRPSGDVRREIADAMDVAANSSLMDQPTRNALRAWATEIRSWPLPAPRIAAPSDEPHVMGDEMPYTTERDMDGATAFTLANGTHVYQAEAGPWRGGIAVNIRGDKHNRIVLPWRALCEVAGLSPQSTAAPGADALPLGWRTEENPGRAFGESAIKYIRGAHSGEDDLHPGGRLAVWVEHGCLALSRHGALVPLTVVRALLAAAPAPASQEGK